MAFGKKLFNSTQSCYSYVSGSVKLRKNIILRIMKVAGLIIFYPVILTSLTSNFCNMKFGNKLFNSTLSYYSSVKLQENIILGIMKVNGLILLYPVALIPLASNFATYCIK